MKIFNNYNRKRYYGLKICDYVSLKNLDGTEFRKGIVVGFGLDNNSVIVDTQNQKQIKWVAEWCEIILKCEDIFIIQNKDNSQENINFNHQIIETNFNENEISITTITKIKLE